MESSMAERALQNWVRLRPSTEQAAVLLPGGANGLSVALLPCQVLLLFAELCLCSFMVV